MLDPEDLRPRDVQFAFTFVEPNTSQLDHIRGLIENGRFRANVNHIFALDEVHRAHEQMESGHTRGTIVLRL